MRRALLSMSAAALAAACGLVIDPDKLVAGNDGADAGTFTPSGGDGDGGANVGPDGGPPGNISSCVPAAPPGTDGPYAVVTGSAGAALACPSGYLGDPVARGKGDLARTAATCGSTAGCSCNASGVASCGLRLRYFDNAACTDEKGNPVTITAGCTEMRSEKYRRVEITASGVSCSASGTATPTAKPVVFGSESIACAADPARTGTCAAGSVPLVATANAVACVVATSKSCPSPYVAMRSLSKNGTVDDQRTCTCSCSASAATACGGGSASVYASKTCTGGSASADIGQCRPMGNFESISGTPPTPTGGSSCTPSATPAGEITPVEDLTLCCLP